MKAIRNINTQLMAFLAAALFGLINSQGVGPKDLFQCRQMCYRTFVQDWHHCMGFKDCKSCWNNCDRQLGPFQVNVSSALRQGSLVLTEIAWDRSVTNTSKQCLVTWEVSGGGLMGNLLTDSSTVELSLWPETVYHVQVTCKQKETGGMRRSFKLIVDTHKLSDITATDVQSIAFNSGSKTLPSYHSTDQSTLAKNDSRMRILKDKSDDFLDSYNPNAKATTSEKRSSSTSMAEHSSVSTTEDSTVVRTKLTDSRPASESAYFITAIFAAVASLVLFLGILVSAALLRSTQKSASLSAKPTDKDVLLQREVLTNVTPAAAVKSPTSVEVTVIAASTTVASDNRTLHV